MRVFIEEEEVLLEIREVEESEGRMPNSPDVGEMRANEDD